MAEFQTFVIVNPRSANGRTGREWKRLETKLQRVIGPFDSALTEAPGHATDLARAALRNGYDLIISAGGDGTNNEVINGWFQRDRAINAKAAFATLPLGTGGDFRKTLKVPRDPLAAAAIVRNAKSRYIDAGKITYTTDEGRRTGYFINIADAGVGGVTVRNVNRTTKMFGGFVSFLWGTVKTSLAYRNLPMRWRVDAGPWREEKVYALIVANGRYFGGGMHIAPEARLDDGLFDVVVIGDVSKTAMALSASALYNGTIAKHAHVHVSRGERVEATSEEEVLLDVDGEQPGRLPATFKVLPGALMARGLF